MGFEILAAVDLHGGRVVRLRHGDFAQVTAHGDDPVATAEELVKSGARWLHVVDLDGARTGRPVHGRMIGAIVRAVGHRAAVEVGGGIRDETTAAELLEAGVTRVVLGTAVLRDPPMAERIIERHGADRVAAAIDVRQGRAVGEAWQPGATAVDPATAVRRLADAGVLTFEVTAVERDGTLEGPDLPALRRLIDLDAGAIIASGGIRSIEDLVTIRDAGCAGAIVGRALYEGRLGLREALERLGAPDRDR